MESTPLSKCVFFFPRLIFWVRRFGSSWSFVIDVHFVRHYCHYFCCAIPMLLSTPPSTPPCSCPVRGQSAMLLSIPRSSGARSSGAHYYCAHYYYCYYCSHCYYCRCICGFLFVFPSASGSNVRSSNSIRRRVPGISHVSDFNYTCCWVSKNPSSCLNTAFKYFIRIWDACLSPVLAQHNASDQAMQLS